jgi:hypothetical protein
MVRFSPIEATFAVTAVTVVSDGENVGHRISALGFKPWEQEPGAGGDYRAWQSSSHREPSLFRNKSSLTHTFTLR